VYAKITYGDDSDSDDEDDFQEGEIIAQLDDRGNAHFLQFGNASNDLPSDESDDDSSEEEDDDFLDFERKELMNCSSFGGMHQRNMKVNRQHLDWLYGRVYPHGNPVVSKELFYHFLLIRCGGEQGFVY
jgi:hypothetical protein